MWLRTRPIKGLQPMDLVIAPCLLFFFFRMIQACMTGHLVDRICREVAPSSGIFYLIIYLFDTAVC